MKIIKESPVGYDGLIAGKLYAVTDGGIVPYKNIACPLTSSTCKESCILFVDDKKDGKCRYKLSLESHEDDYREIDNLLNIPSSLTSLSEQSEDVEEVVSGIPSSPISSLPSVEDDVDNFLKYQSHKSVTGTKNESEQKV